MAADPLSKLHRRSGGSPAGRAEAIARFAFAVPSEAALEAIVRHAPRGVIEIGAGTGYWAALLHNRGLDVIAVDTAPAPSPDNTWFADVGPWFPVAVGGVETVDEHGDRCLLLIWPTMNETWPANAVRRFHAAGGRSVAYIGEPPGGRTGDDVFHRLLGAIEHCHRCTYGLLDRPCVCDATTLFHLVEEVEIPTWQGFDNHLGVYRRVERRARGD